MTSSIRCARPSIHVVMRIAYWVLAFTATLNGGFEARAYIRFVHYSSGTPLAWPSKSVPYTILAAGSDDVMQDDSEKTAIRLAFRRWEQAPDSGLHFVEDTSKQNLAPASGLDGDNLVFFDETDATGLFSGAPQIIALTTVYYDGSGRIVEADLVFNGKDHSFSTNLAAGTYDVEAIAAHEIGHYLGLDHSGVYGATMNPYASLQDTRPRSLSKDEVAFVRAVYPASGVNSGAVSGRVLWSADGSPVSGAHVVVMRPDTGELAASGMTRSDGTYTVAGLEAGSYRVYVEPLDGPTSAANIGSGTIETGFGTLWYGGNASPTTISVNAGSTVSLGDLAVSAPSSSFNLTGATPRAVRRGQTVDVYLSGTGLSAGQIVRVFGSGITLEGGASANETSLASGSRFRITVDSNAPTGLRDIYVEREGPSGMEVVALPGGLEIEAAPPALVAADPVSAPQAGGSTITLSGSGFENGAVVVFGDVPAETVTVLSSSTIEVVAPAHALGAVDLTVINPDGQETRLTGGFNYTGDPIIDSVLPANGPTAGGVSVTIYGSQFAAGASVWIGDAQATNVVVDAAGTSITCTTPAGLAGAADVVVVNPDGRSDTAFGAYTYALPQLSEIDPAAGSTSGGAKLRIRGDNFSPVMQVWFGENLASSVVFLSQTELEVKTPAGAEGVVDVTVETSDAQVAVLPSAFTYVSATQPVITSVSPASGPTAGGTEVAILGSGFAAGVQVSFGGVEATEVTLISQGEIRVRTPAASPGSVDVTIRNPSTLEAKAFGAFTYQAPSISGSSGGGGGCALMAGGAHAGVLLPWFVVLACLVLVRRALLSRRHPVVTTKSAHAPVAGSAG